MQELVAYPASILQPDAQSSVWARMSVPAATPSGVCAACHTRHTCMPSGIGDEAIAHFEPVVYRRRRVSRGERLFSANDRSGSLYAVRSGLFKTSVCDVAGRDQVTGFQMGGDLLGLDALHDGICASSATALEDSHVCAMPFNSIEAASIHLPVLRRRLYAVLAGEITRSQQMLIVLGGMNGEQRLAAFLLDMSRRFLRRGYSGSSFTLRMTRAEIGSYIGLTLETVSRLFSAFQRSGLVEVRQKQVCNLDLKRLDAILAADG